VNYGIDTIWYNAAGNTNNKDIKPTKEVSNFNELRKLLFAG